MKWIAFAVLAAMAPTCRHSRLSYSLQAQGRTLVLIPPVRSSSITISNARKQAPEIDCDIAGDFLNLRWHGTTARIQPKSIDIFDQSGGERIYTDALASIEAFRSALLVQESIGCFQASDRSRLLRTVTEQLPLSVTAAYYLRFGALGYTGFFDLTPDFRLKVVKPTSSNYQIDYYPIKAAPNDDRVRVSFISDSFAYSRLLFWTSRSSTNHYATFLTAWDRNTLEKATRLFQAQPEGSCESVVAAGSMCLTLPNNVAVNPELRVRANGHEAFVPIGGTLRDLLNPNRDSTEPPKTLKVRRFYRGRLIPVAGRELFGLVLMPGDEITW
jgi:hypothetical protein